MKELSNPVLTPREKAIIKAYSMAVGGNASGLMSSIESQRNNTQVEDIGLAESQDVINPTPDQSSTDIK